ncbi:unnamed protein product [Linum trigynum]|uniref:Uncharacterized protein n=1 Tax=Linum trigynum TaxID=586398 RepID=A0AAV2E5V9_9ROSI
MISSSNPAMTFSPLPPFIASAKASAYYKILLLPIGENRQSHRDVLGTDSIHHLDKSFVLVYMSSFSLLQAL